MAKKKERKNEKFLKKLGSFLKKLDRHCHVVLYGSLLLRWPVMQPASAVQSDHSLNG